MTVPGQVFFAGHIPQVITTGHSIFAPKQHKNSLNSANRTRQALMYIFSKNMFRLGAQLLWPVKETRLTAPCLFLSQSSASVTKQSLDEVEHDIIRKPNSIIVLLYIFHIIQSSETEAKRSAILFLRRTLQGA